MLYDFIVTNRERIIECARRRVRERIGPMEFAALDAKQAEFVVEKLENGVPLFLTQLAEALAPAARGGPLRLVNAAASKKEITDSAALHGHELLRDGYTVAQVVHGYGDVCQVVTELATQEGATIRPAEFHAFNLCIDDAIAGAVTAYGRQRERDVAYEGTERLGVLAHELRNLLNTATLSFDIIKKGKVGLGGSTAAVHSRSLVGLTALVERSLAEVRLDAGVPMLQRITVSEFIEEMAITAGLQAEGFGLQLAVTPVDVAIAIDADRQLLASALTNLLLNAFKFTRGQGKVSLTTRATADRVLIEVRDECGGLPPGKTEELFRPFTRRTTDNSGLGLGLSIALRAVEANSGHLRVRDLPGEGCVFTIDLPRRPASPGSIFHVLPDAEHESPSGATGSEQVRGAHSRGSRSGS